MLDSRTTDSRSLGEIVLLATSPLSAEYTPAIGPINNTASAIACLLVLPPTLGSLSYTRDRHRLLLLYTKSPPLLSHPVRRALTYDRPRRVPRSFNN